METVTNWKKFLWDKILSGQQILKKAQEVSKALLFRLGQLVYTPPDYWVNVRSLENLSDGGILDPDDQVYDVADDREKLLAIFEEQGRPLPPHNGGDGTSASSAGTASPEMFHSEITSALGRDRDRGPKVGFQPYHVHDIDVDVTSAHITDNKLHVRHGSEPALRSVSPISHEGESKYEEDEKEKRWSTVAAFEGTRELVSSSPQVRKYMDASNGIDRRIGNGEDDLSAFSRFGRDSARHSILGNHPSMFKWAEAQDRLEIQHNSNRRDPLGGDLPVVEKSPADGSSQDSDIESFYVDIQNDGEPVGLHVVPYTDSKDGSELGMLVKGVEEGSKAYRDGRILMNDRIMEINNNILAGVTFERAQEIFRMAMTTFPYVRLRIERDKQPSRQISEEDSPMHSPSEDVHIDGMGDIPDVAREARPGTPIKRKPPTVPLRSPSTVLTTPPMKDRTNVRKIGKKLHIQLTKGPQGLGFSITTRDNPAGGKNPIYIKNILPKGAAITDGRLKPGDRLLEVNGIEMTGKPQAEAVSILRSTKLGSAVHLVVSRQDNVSAKLPRQLPNQDSEELSNPSKNKEILTFDIPLNDTGSAGLGVSVKGKTTGVAKGTGVRDLGIFIKAVIHGGAASKDGRLRQNDQLLYINDVSLLKLSNGQAMETLRRAMSSEKSPRSTIKLVVARRSDSSPSSPSSFTNLSFTSSDKFKSQESLSGSNDQLIDIGLMHSKSEDNVNRNTPSSHTSAPSASASETSENSDNTVLYNPALDADATPEDLQGSLRNPLVTRLTPGSALARNNSYNLAVFTRGSPTKFTMNPDSGDTESNFKPSHGNQGIVAPTLPMGNTETVIIEDTDTEQEHPVAETSLSPTVPVSPQWTDEWDGNEKSPELDGAAFFQRDGFGRQSISEKHKGSSTIDAKQTDWYAKHRKSDESSEVPDGITSTTQQDATDVLSPGALVRVNSADSLINRSSIAEKQPDSDSTQTMPVSYDGDKNDIGPSLGMKKSSSLESLQTMVAEVTSEDVATFPRPKAKVVRGRGCNESFRAAVDRSYDSRDAYEDDDDEDEEALEALEEISDDLESRSRSGSTRSSVDSLSNTSDPITGKPLKHDKTKQKKKSGLFKGLFKFGQKRKPVGEPRQMEPLRPELAEKQKQEEIERYKARQAAKDEHQRIQEQHRKLREQQALQKRLEELNKEALTKGVQMKADRMAKLRQQHQQRHQQQLRQGMYSRNEEEDDDDEDSHSNSSNYSSTDAHITQYLTQRENRYQEARNSPIPKATDNEHPKMRHAGGRDSPSVHAVKQSRPRSTYNLDHTKPELRYSDYYARQPKSMATYGSLGRPPKLQTNTQPQQGSEVSDREQYPHSNVSGRRTPSLQTQSQSQQKQQFPDRGQYSHSSTTGRSTPSLRTDYQDNAVYHGDGKSRTYDDTRNYADSRHYKDNRNYHDDRNQESSGYYADNYGESVYSQDTWNHRDNKYNTNPKSYRHSTPLDDEYSYSHHQGNQRNYADARNYEDSRNYSNPGNYSDSRNHDNARDYRDSKYYYRDPRDPEKV
ncbi:partitioning defective 3 homolog [Glandiceps talaboti]